MKVIEGHRHSSFRVELVELKRRQRAVSGGTHKLVNAEVARI